MALVCYYNLNEIIGLHCEHMKVNEITGQCTPIHYALETIGLYCNVFTHESEWDSWPVYTNTLCTGANWPVYTNTLCTVIYKCYLQVFKMLSTQRESSLQTPTPVHITTKSATTLLFISPDVSVMYPWTCPLGHYVQTVYVCTINVWPLLCKTLWKLPNWAHILTC